MALPKTAVELRDRLDRWPTRHDMRLFAQGYMERAIGWVRPAAHFTQLRAGWDCADSDLAAVAQQGPGTSTAQAEGASTDD